MNRSLRTFLVASAALLATDQLIKAWARAVTEGVEGRSINALWPGVFELKLIYNHGIAFGLFQGAGVFMAPIALVMAGVAGWHSFKHPKEPFLVHLTTASLAAGAIGNLIDRLWMGKVTDMFWIRIINFPVFNFADMCITFAGIMLVLGAVMDVFRGAPEKETAEPEKSAEPQP